MVKLFARNTSVPPSTYYTGRMNGKVNSVVHLGAIRLVPCRTWDWGLWSAPSPPPLLAEGQAGSTSRATCTSCSPRGAQKTETERARPVIKARIGKRFNKHLHVD